MEQNQGSNLFNLTLDAQNSYTLRSVASWAKVLGVVSIIVAILCAVMGVIMQQALNNGGFNREFRGSGFSANSFGNAGLIMYVIIAIIYLMSGIFALNAGNKISLGLRTNNMEALNSGFAGARNFFALWAILMILFLVLILIGVLGQLGNS